MRISGGNLWRLCLFGEFSGQFCWACFKFYVNSCRDISKNSRVSPDLIHASSTVHALYYSILFTNRTIHRISCYAGLFMHGFEASYDRAIWSSHLTTSHSASFQSLIRWCMFTMAWIERPSEKLGVQFLVFGREPGSPIWWRYRCKLLASEKVKGMTKQE